MTLQELNTILKASGFPVAYSHFNQAVKPPFITYLVVGSANFKADNRVYKRIDDINIELYTNKKDEVAEQKLEDLLDENELVWEVDEAWIESEKLYQRVYQISIIKNKI